MVLVFCGHHEIGEVYESGRFKVDPGGRAQTLSSTTCEGRALPSYLMLSVFKRSKEKCNSDLAFGDCLATKPVPMCSCVALSADPSTYPPICLCFYPPVYISMCILICLSAIYLPFDLSTNQFVRLPAHVILPDYLSIHLPTYLSIYRYRSFYPSTICL